MSHTPGPWKLRGYAGQHDEGGAAIQGPDGFVVGYSAPVRSYHSPDSWREYHANAALIAAAPTLLDVCRAALERIESDVHENWVEAGALRAAIALATGGGR